MKILLDDMILTKAMPTAAGSKMLDGYKSLFDATVVEKLSVAGEFEIVGKAPVGEMGIDLAGETCFNGKVDNKALFSDVGAMLAFDVNGAPRRIAAQNGYVYIKPTYGIVSRFGTVSVACSGECVGVMAKKAEECEKVLCAVVGNDVKDGTMHSDERCKNALNDKKAVKKVAVLSMGVENTELDKAKKRLTENGIEVKEINSELTEIANIAWNILMCAELCNNVSRFDGIKYGYRTKNYKNVDELYTNSRTEAFGELLKKAILYGSDVLSSANYMSKYDKSLRVRRLVVEELGKILSEYDVIMLPTCSKAEYTENDDVFVENKFTAPASISGLPVVVVNGVQLMGSAFADGTLLELAKSLEKEER